MKLLNLEFYCRKILTVNSISLINIDLFCFSNYFHIHFATLHFSRNFSISSRLLSLLPSSFSKYILIICLKYIVSVVVSLLSFLMWVHWFSLISLDRGLSVALIFPKKQIWGLLIFFVCSLTSTLMIISFFSCIWD